MMFCRILDLGFVDGLFFVREAWLCGTGLAWIYAVHILPCNLLRCTDELLFGRFSFRVENWGDFGENSELNQKRNSSVVCLLVPSSWSR
jgi:hypothetical protein